MNKVLVVEDSRAVAQVLDHLIRSDAGLEPVLCQSLAEAQAQLTAQQEWLAAVLDLNLPDAPNGEIVPLIIERAIPSIVLTGSFDEARRDALLRLGVVDYVLKESAYSFDYVSRLLQRLDRNRYIKVLVVDDAASSRGLVAALLRQQNFQVVEAADGVEALQQLAAHGDIRLVLTDYNMPQMDGFTLTARIRQKHNREAIAIIGVSAQDGQTISAKFIKHGANDFITKPFSPEEFLTRVMQNIEILEYIEKVRDTANRDYLTGLYNRRYFFEVGGAQYEKAKAAYQPMAMAIVDIDHFKRINDTYGHDVGDVVLKHMAGLLLETLAGHLVARFGGEEFCIFLNGVALDEAVSLLERLRQRVEQTQVEAQGLTINFTLSAGVHGGAEQNMQAMLKRADAFLYQAKNAGRNRVIST